MALKVDAKKLLAWCWNQAETREDESWRAAFGCMVRRIEAVAVEVPDTANAELAEACEAHEAWAEAEHKHLGSFHDRMEICNLSEYLTRKALAMVRGQEFTEKYKGVPQLIIRTNAKPEGSQTSP